MVRVVCLLKLKNLREVFFFGKSVASGGDANNDGHDDIIIIDPRSYIEQQNTLWDYNYNEIRGYGRIFVYSGADYTLLWSYVFKLPNEDITYRDGINAQFLGDINNDDCDDIIVGMPGVLDLHGAVGVYSGRTGEELVFYTGSEDDYMMGRDVIGLGDVNFDNVPDYAYVSDYGAYGMNGTVTVRSGLDHTIISTISQPWPRRIRSAGDMNHDNSDDIIVGSNSIDENYPFVVYTYSAIDGEVILGIRAPRRKNDDSFGYMIAGGADVTGDDIPDILVLGNFYIIHYPVYLFSGADGKLLREYIIDGDDWGYGTYLSFTDINGDGKAEVMIGSTSYLYFYDTPTNNLMYKTRIFQMDAYVWGNEISTGDFNNDGKDDIVAGGARNDYFRYVNLTGGGRLLLRFADDSRFSQSLGSYFVRRDNSYDFIIYGNNPGRPVYLLISRVGDDCTYLKKLGICIDLNMPIENIGKGITDANREAVITVKVAQYADLDIRWLQAVDPFNVQFGPVTSNVVKVEVVK